ncbi:S8 family serine peptidase [Planococcus liqunii]|uniref:S8 family serine peptidase n=1 Tax=Planococcus liqunii TaxID=3058394 RepID=UPI0026321F1D|nr:S8 family serine peptidase [Planococcus sp. N056]WKA50765.1 S8 family serine peptidase [Planococcus sp. N056]
MNVQHKLPKTLAGILALSVSMSCLTPSAQAAGFPKLPVQAVEDESKMIYLFQEGTNLRMIAEDIQGIDPGASINAIQEIETLTVKASGPAQNNKVKKHVQNEFGTLITEVGEDQTVKAGDVRPSSMPPVSTLMPLASAPQNLKSEADSTYTRWLWDIDLVTQNGASRDIESGNHGVKVGIVDSGLDFNHSDLKANIVSKGRSLVDGVADTQDYMGHGTMVAGSIAANGHIKGIAPEIGIVPYKVFHTGNADSSDVIEAIVAAANDDMDVINLSLGVYKSLKNKDEKAVYAAYKRALKYAEKENSFVVASSGTESAGFDIFNAKKLAAARGFSEDAQLHMPGGLEDVFTVAATNKGNALTFYSNYGKNVSIGAPGGDYGPLADQGLYDVRHMTLTTYPTNLMQSITSEYAGFEKGYEFMTGTSLAAPKVSATAALVIAEYEEVHGKKPKVQEVKKILEKGAVKSDKKKFGAGIVNAYNSLTLIK